MGNDILSSDMLVGGLIRSMYNGFQFKDYQEGCWAMHDLNEFLKTFGGYDKDKEGKSFAKMAIDDMPEPDGTSIDIRGRQNPDAYYENYRKMYAGKLMKCLGIYQRTMIDAIKNRM